MPAGRYLRTVYASGTPYVATLEAQGHDVDQRLATVRFPGLVWIHTTEEGEQTRIVTYWRTREHFERDEKALRSLLAGATVQSHGFLRAARDPRAWWKRLTWQEAYGIFATIVAIVAGWGTLSAPYHWWTAPPSLDLRVEQATTNAMDDEIVRDTFQIANRSSAPQRVHSLRAEVLHDGKPFTTAEVEQWAGPPLRTDAFVPIRVNAGPLPAGTYELRLTATGRAGRLRPSQDFPITTAFKIWSREVVLTDFSLVSGSTDKATFRCVIPVGPALPDGLLLDIIVKKQPGLENVLTTTEGAETVRPWKYGSTTSGSEVAMTTIRLPRCEPFQTREYEIVMLSSEPVDWQHVRENTEIRPRPAERRGGTS